MPVINEAQQKQTNGAPQQKDDIKDTPSADTQGQISNGEDTTSTSTPTNNDTQPKTIPTPHITDQEARLVVFIGPASSGKSMILVRLAKYLRKNNYTINTDNTFLFTNDYANDCTDFKNKLNTNIALDGSVKFLLVDVFDTNARLAAKLLEAPGEDFYKKGDPKKNGTIEPYLATILASPNPKTYVILLDLDSKDPQNSLRRDDYNRENYAQRILDYFYPVIKSSRDKIILLYNKIDVTNFGTINGCQHPKMAYNDAKKLYPQLFAKMKVRKLVFFEVDNFSFKTFCTGIYSPGTDDQGNRYETYTIADDVYPRELWEEITKRW